MIGRVLSYVFSLTLVGQFLQQLYSAAPAAAHLHRTAAATALTGDADVWLLELTCQAVTAHISLFLSCPMSIIMALPSS